MHIALKEYEAAYQVQVKRDIVDFFAFHGGLVGEREEASAQAEEEAEEVLENWRRGRSALYAILDGEAYAGFLRLEYRGDQVAWIEDLYVRPERRGQGIASQAIGQAEKIVAARPGYTALCMDVVPRNTQALNLYYRLGYDTLSLITLRKEFGENPRDQKASFLGKEFRV